MVFSCALMTRSWCDNLVPPLCSQSNDEVRSGKSALALVESVAEAPRNTIEGYDVSLILKFRHLLRQS